MKQAVKYEGYLHKKNVYFRIGDFHRYILVLSVTRVNEIVVALFFVGDFGWVRYLGVVKGNQGVAFLVFLYIEKGIFFHI